MGNRVIVLLSFLLIASLALNGYLWLQMGAEIEFLQQKNDGLTTQVNNHNQSLQSCTEQLDLYRSRIHQLQTEVGTNMTGIQGAASLQAPAVIQQVEVMNVGPFTRRVVVEEGKMLDIAVELEPGNGRVLVQTTPLTGVMFQDAANTAAFVAQDVTDTSLNGSDVTFSITAEEEVPGIDGPSAGALMTLVTISAIEGEALNPDVTITGTIDDEGNIGSIGGVVEKAEAARDNGKELLLIPEENQRLVIEDTTGRSIGNMVIDNDASEVVDAETYIEEEVGIDVEYVDTIEDVLEYALIAEE